jgi:hypothetical protein
MDKRIAGLLGAVAGLALLSSAAVTPAAAAPLASQPSADALPVNAKVAEYDRDHDRSKHVVIIKRHHRVHPRHEVVIEREPHHHAKHVVIERERPHRHHNTVGVGVEINR